MDAELSAMTQLAALLKLCDDPSPAVAGKVARRLRELADEAPRGDLLALIEAQRLEITDAQRAALQAILAAPEAEDSPNDEAAREAALRAAWRDLASEADETLFLEIALLELCAWQSGAESGERGRDLLDELAIEFGDFELPPDAPTSAKSGEWSEAGALAYFLFDYKGLSGAPADRYYHPLQSNLTAVIETGHGLPITLACVFILVGRRVGLSIQGCSFPGHFLARDGQSQRVFDPFNGGRALSAREVGALKRAAPAEMSEAAPAREIVARVLRNLSVAYYQSGESEKSALMLALLHGMEP